MRLKARTLAEELGIMMPIAPNKAFILAQSLVESSGN
jgi:hypothetical protein